MHEELVAATAWPGGGAHAEDVGLHGDGGVVGEEVVADDVAEVPTPQVVDLQARFDTYNLILISVIFSDLMLNSQHRHQRCRDSCLF